MLGLSGVVSLLDMLPYRLTDFLELSQAIHVLGFDARYRESTRSSRPLAIGHMKRVLPAATALSMDSTVAQIPRINGALASDNFECDDDALAVLMGELDKRIYDELAARKFSYVARDRAEYIGELWLDDTPVAIAFPTSHRELKSAGRCYALDEPTASVMHSMRGLEVGLNALAEKLAVPFERRNWENIINDIDGQIRTIKGPEFGTSWREDQQFYSDAALEFRYLKNSWRNHAMHTHETYDDGDAKRILEHSVSFFEILSQRLKEPNGEASTGVSEVSRAN